MMLVQIFSEKGMKNQNGILKIKGINFVSKKQLFLSFFTSCCISQLIIIENIKEIFSS